MRSSRPSASRLLLLVASFNLLVQSASSRQVTLIHVIQNRGDHCIYERFERGEYATFEIFILDSDDQPPEAGVQVEGPVIGPEVGVVRDGGRSWDTAAELAHSQTKDADGKTKMGALMLDWIERQWPLLLRTKATLIKKGMGILRHSFHIDYTHSGESEDAVAALLAEGKMDEDEWERNRERDRRKRNRDNVVADYDNFGEDKKMQEVEPDSYDPYAMTRRIKSPGWYRMCVHADNQIRVEMDIRSGDVKGISPDTGHVYTHDEREQLDDEKELIELFSRDVEEKLVAEELEKALKDQVKDYDLESTRKLMTEVKGVVTKMMMRQQEAHHRMRGHEGDAKRNYKRILKSGLIETVLYILITLFQVYTVHKWLLSNNVLGR